MFSIGGFFDVGVWFFVIGMINEASTPLLSAMFIVKYCDSQSKWLMPIGMTFTVIFFFCRIVFRSLISMVASFLGFNLFGPIAAWSFVPAEPWSLGPFPPSPSPNPSTSTNKKRLVA